MENDIDTLISISGKSHDYCKKVLEDCSYDLNTAAVILLSDTESENITLEDFQLQEEEDNNSHNSSHNKKEDKEEYDCEDQDYDEEEYNSNNNMNNKNNKNNNKRNYIELDKSSEEIDKMINLIEKEEKEKEEEEEKQKQKKMKEEIEEIDQDQPCSYLFLIPNNRLHDLLEKIKIPITIDFKQIWTAENIIPIPGGITICEISSDSKRDLDSFLFIVEAFLIRYKMSTCFNIESITKRSNRIDYIKRMETLYYDLLDVNPKRTYQKFHKKVVFDCSIVYDEAEINNNPGDLAVNNQLAHVLTITLTGLPELILVLQDAAQSIATSLSSSSLTGNSLLCIPNEWSLLCHTMPYSLVLIEPDSIEWNTVLENGKWKSKTTPSKVKCIHRVENIELWRAYCSKRDGIERLRGDANEQWYWHGTKSLSPEVIAKEGFDFRVANPGSFGCGAYFAHSVNYSSSGYQHPIPSSYHIHQQNTYNSNYKSNKKRKGYIYNPVTPTSSFSSTPASTTPFQMGVIGGGGGGYNSGFNSSYFPSPGFSNNLTTVTNSVMKFPDDVGVGDFQLILARVCVGKTSEGGNMSMRRPPNGYDSVTSSPTMTIVYDLAMAYPAYIITYR